MIKKNGAGTAPSNNSIWDEFSEQHHQNKAPYSMQKLAFFLNVQI